MYLEKMSLAASASGRSILIFTSSRPGRRIAGSIMSSRLEAPITMTFSRPSTPSISDSSCGHDRVLDVGGDAGAAGAEDRVHLVEEHDHRRALGGLLPGPLEDQPDVPLGLADVLVEQLRALDVEEEALPLGLRRRLRATCLARELATALAISVLPQPGGPYSRTPLGGRSWCSRNRSACRYGSSTASRIGSICRTGHRSRRSRCRGPPRGRAPRPRPWGSARRRSRSGARAGASHRRAAADVPQRVGQPDHALLVGVRDDQGALAVLEDLLEHHDFAVRSRTRATDDVERLVEHDLLATPQLVELDRRG